MDNLQFAVEGQVLGISHRDTRNGGKLYTTDVYGDGQLVSIMSMDEPVGKKGQQFSGRVKVSGSKYGLDIWVVD